MNPTYLTLGTLVLAALTFAANFLLAPSRAKQKALRDELEAVKALAGKNASELSHHEHRLTGFSVQMERYADKHEERCEKIEGELKQINRLSEDVAAMKEKINGQVEATRDIKEMLGKMFDLMRAPSKN